MIYYSDGYILNQARVSVRGNKIYHTSSLDYTQSTFIAEMEEGKKNMTRTGNHLGESEETLYIIVETESGCVLHTLKADGSYQ